MNEAHYHLVLNHFPIIAPIIGLLVLVAGFIARGENIKRTAYGIFIFGALTAVAASATGEGAEEVVEHLSGISHQLIHEHEEAAETFALIAYLLGIASIAALWISLKNQPYRHYVSYAIAVFAAVAISFGITTGTTGGSISHPEIRTGAATDASPDAD